MRNGLQAGGHLPKFHPLSAIYRYINRGLSAYMCVYGSRYGEETRRLYAYLFHSPTLIHLFADLSMCVVSVYALPRTKPARVLFIPHANDFRGGSSFQRLTTGYRRHHNYAWMMTGKGRGAFDDKQGAITSTPQSTR